ncbi:unnamed protein product [Dovyalis caffra]|uniref:Ribosomal protein L20 n=1 Tax=Dovyalis caffra TaxID=77055 RepID=A0AAV1S4J2_9ROSI|nr:unnamed protein product [Dovyalis caffra]
MSDGSIIRKRVNRMRLQLFKCIDLNIPIIASHSRRGKNYLSHSQSRAFGLQSNKAANHYPLIWGRGRVSKIFERYRRVN